MEAWIKSKIGLSKDQRLTRELIEEYQLKKIKEIIIYAKENSLFYRHHLKNVKPQNINSISDIQDIPFVNADDIRKNGIKMLCTGQDEIKRIVTLNTSGTTGEPKKLFFTAEDLELTIDFFHEGMKYLVDKDDVVLILMPCKIPDSIGDLLARGLERLGAKAIAFGIPEDLKKLSEIVRSEKVTSIVGIPVHVLELAEVLGKPEDIKIKTVLLSADYIPDSLSKRIENKWNCKVFEHYGSTEMGYGGAVQCAFTWGMHPREADLYFEIIDPETGLVLPEGEFGEIVVTTLTRKGMPLIRYRTGDYGRWLKGNCPCGTALKSLDKVRHRIADNITLDGYKIDITKLDEALFRIEGLCDYEAKIFEENGKYRLRLDLSFSPHDMNLTGKKRKITRIS